MALEQANVVQAACVLDGTAVPAAFLNQRGFTGVVTDTGTGDWSIALSQPTGVNDRVVQATVRGATDLIVTVVQTDATNMRIRAFSDAGAATDAVIDILVISVV